MGSREIFARSSEESLRDIVELKTPSPLTSNGSSESNQSLLSDINKYVSGESVKIFENKIDEEITSKKELPGFVDFERNSKNSKDNLSSSIETSSSSSPSSLKQRIRDFPSSSEDLKFNDRLAALDRRMRREKDVYLHLHGLNNRIDEKDEGEVSSSEETGSTRTFRKEGRSRTRINMCSSAPDTMRMDNKSSTLRFSNKTMDVVLSQGSKKFEATRPPRYLQPLELPTREIIRSNAPPLCLSDRKIVQFLKRGSASAREEHLKTKTSGKLAAYGKPTGVIIDNLSSGSEDGESRTNDWTIGKPSETIKHCTRPKIPEEIRCTDLPGSSREKCGSMMEMSLKNSTGDFKSANCQDARSLIIPKLKIRSQEYSQSTSITSRENTAKKSLDVEELIRALSDISIQQQMDNGISSAKNHVPISGSAGRRSCDRTGDPAELVERRYDVCAVKNHNDKLSRKIENAHNSGSTNSLDSPETSPKITRKKSLTMKNNFRSFDSLRKSHYEELEKMNKKIIGNDRKGEFSEPVTFRKRRNFSPEYSNNLREDPASSDERFKYLERGSKIPYAGRSESSSSEKRVPRSTINHARISNQLVKSYSCAEQTRENSRGERKKKLNSTRNGAKFQIYEDGCENSSGSRFSIEKLKKTNLSPPPSSKSNRNIREQPKYRSNVESDGKTGTGSDCSPEKSNRDSSAKTGNGKSKNLSWTNNLSDSSPEIASSLNSQIRDSENSNRPESRSCLISDSVTTVSNENSPEYSSENIPNDCEVGEIETKAGRTLKEAGDTFASSSSVIKRLSYTELQEPEMTEERENEWTEREKMIDSYERKVEKSGRSESAIDALRRSTDESTLRGQVSSSLSRLKNLPEEPSQNSSNLRTRKKSQDRFPFTITDGNSSKKLKGEIVEQPETAYRLKFCSTVPRSPSGRITFPKTRTMNTYLQNARISNLEKRGSFVPKIRRFVGKLSRWKKLKKSDDDLSTSGTTRILYENEECRDEESSRTTNDSAERRERRCNRDGLWVVGLGQRSDERRAKTIVSNALTINDEKCQFTNATNFYEEDPMIDGQNGCFCSKICRFLIGGSHNHRYSFPPKNSTSGTGKTFSIH